MSHLYCQQEITLTLFLAQYISIALFLNCSGKQLFQAFVHGIIVRDQGLKTETTICEWYFGTTEYYYCTKKTMQSENSMCKESGPKLRCDSGIGRQLIKKPEYTNTNADQNFRIVGQARSSFNLSALYLNIYLCA